MATQGDEPLTFGPNPSSAVDFLRTSIVDLEALVGLAAGRTSDVASAGLRATQKSLRTRP